MMKDMHSDGTACHGRWQAVVETQTLFFQGVPNARVTACHLEGGMRGPAESVA